MDPARFDAATEREVKQFPTSVATFGVMASKAVRFCAFTISCQVRIEHGLQGEAIIAGALEHPRSNFASENAPGNVGVLFHGEAQPPAPSCAVNMRTTMAAAVEIARRHKDDWGAQMPLEALSDGDLGAFARASLELGNDARRCPR